MGFQANDHESRRTEMERLLEIFSLIAWRWDSPFDAISGRAGGRHSADNLELSRR